MKKEEKIRCAICGKEINYRESNNAHPVVDDRCCSECNNIVTQLRGDTFRDNALKLLIDERIENIESGDTDVELFKFPNPFKSMEELDANENWYDVVLYEKNGEYKANIFGDDAETFLGVEVGYIVLLYINTYLNDNFNSK